LNDENHFAYLSSILQLEAAVLELPLSCTQSSLERTKSVLSWVVLAAMGQGGVAR